MYPPIQARTRGRRPAHALIDVLRAAGAVARPRRLPAERLRSTSRTIVRTSVTRLTMLNRRGATLAAMLALVALALPIGAVAAAEIRIDGVESGTFHVLGSCSDGLLLEVTGSGRATYLGEYSGRYRECFDPSTGVVAGGSFTLTTANGDTVFGTFTGRALPAGGSNVEYDDPGVISGGTGRFTDAGGSINTRGIADLATGEYNGTLDGSVSRPASP